MAEGAKVAFVGLQFEEAGLPGVSAADTPVLTAQQPQGLIGTH